MPIHPARLCAAATVLLVAACASPLRTTELGRIDEHAGYRYATLDQKAPKTIDKSAVIMSFSGGGTRAAALADGALRALAATASPPPPSRWAASTGSRVSSRISSSAT
jgi:NTE family protein